MEREKIFRGQRTNNNEWVYGYYVKDPEGRHRIYLKPFEGATSNTYYFVIPETVEEYINSNDSKGNPIYGDDMLGGASGVVFVVKWKDDEMRWAMQDVYTGNWFNINATILEVVGNIHENPELIVKP